MILDGLVPWAAFASFGVFVSVSSINDDLAFPGGIAAAIGIGSLAAVLSGLSISELCCRHRRHQGQVQRETASFLTIPTFGGKARLASFAASWLDLLAHLGLVAASARCLTATLDKLCGEGFHRFISTHLGEAHSTFPDFSAGLVALIALLLSASSSLQRSSSPVRALTCLLIAGYAVTFFFGFSQVGAELTIRRQDDTKAHNRGIHEVLAASGSIVLILSCGASSAFFVKADLKCSSSVFVTVSQFVLAVALFILGLILPFMVKRRSPSNATWESSLLNTFEASFARGDNFAIYLIAVFIICALVLAILEFGFILNGKTRSIVKGNFCSAIPPQRYQQEEGLSRQSRTSYDALSALPLVLGTIAAIMATFGDVSHILKAASTARILVDVFTAVYVLLLRYGLHEHGLKIFHGESTTRILERRAKVNQRRRLRRRRRRRRRRLRKAAALTTDDEIITAAVHENSSNTRRASEEDPTFDLTTATGEASTSFLKEVFAAPKNCTEDTKARTSVAAAQSFSSQQFAARSTAVNTCRDEQSESDSSLSTHSSSSSLYSSDDDFEDDDDEYSSDSSRDRSDYGTEDDDDDEEEDERNRLVDDREEDEDDEAVEHREEDEFDSYREAGLATVSQANEEPKNHSKTASSRHSTSASSVRHVTLAFTLVLCCFLLQSVANFSGLASQVVGNHVNGRNKGALATMIVLNLVLCLIYLPVLFFISKQPQDCGLTSKPAPFSLSLAFISIFFGVNLLFVSLAKSWIEILLWSSIGVAVYLCSSGNREEMSDNVTLSLRKLRHKARNTCFRERLLAQSLLVSSNLAPSARITQDAKEQSNHNLTEGEIY